MPNQGYQLLPKFFMPPIKRGRKATNHIETEEGFVLSQSSSGHDEQRKSLKATLTEAAKLRQAKDEKAFLRTAEKSLNSTISNIAEDINENMTAMQDLWASFLVEYATVEDRLRRKLVELKQTEDEFKKLALDRKIEAKEIFKQDVRLRLSTLQQFREPCEVSESLVNNMLSEDEINIEELL